MWSVRILALAAAGCRGILGIEAPIHTDAAAGDAPASCATWQPLLFEPCTLGAPQPALTLDRGPYRYDTSTEITAPGGTLYEGTSVLRQSGLTITLDGKPIAVLSVESLTIGAGARLTVEGRKPLLVVAWSKIEIDGTIDASSHIGIINAVAHIAQTVQFGAGASEGCTVNVGEDGLDAPAQGGAGGGGGGGYQGSGGRGADGSKPVAAGGAGGAMRPAVALRGGCPGGRSGSAGPIATLPATTSTRAEGGAGGGAIRLVAHDSIAVAGSISANGAGGAGAPQSSACGGGGGGAGGYLALEAPAIAISGALTANGGGGGGGGAPTNAGNDGVDGQTSLEAASGGAPATGCGAAGGEGSVTTQLAGSNASSDACGGGGGGGGGGGYVFITSPDFTMTGDAKLSPRPQSQ